MGSRKQQQKVVHKVPSDRVQEVPWDREVPSDRVQAGTGRALTARRVLVAVVAVGFVLRAACLLWGIPILPYEGVYHPDEGISLLHVIQFPQHYLDGQSFIYGSTVPYLIGAALLPLRPLLDGNQYLLAGWLGLRIVSLVAGTGAVLLTFHLGRRMFGERTGLWSASLLAVSLTHCMNSSFGNFDVIVSFLLVACFLLVLRQREQPTLGRAALLGVCMGGLAGAKITAVIILAIPLLAMWLPREPEGQVLGNRSQKRRLMGHLVAAYAIALLVYAVSNAHVVVQIGRFWDYFHAQQQLWMDRRALPLGEMLAQWWNLTAEAVGAPILVLALVGMAALGRRWWGSPALLGAYLVLHYLLLRQHFFVRSAAQIAPLLCLFAGYACERGLALSHGLARTLVAAGTTGCLVFSLAGCVNGIHVRWNEPRTAAARYIANQLPSRSTIGLFSLYEHRSIWEYPLIRPGRARLQSFLAGPDFLVVSSLTFDRASAALDSPHMLAGYRWDPAYAGAWQDYRVPGSQVFRFFSQVVSGQGYRLIQSFEATSTSEALEFAGVGIRIYQRIGAPWASGPREKG